MLKKCRSCSSENLQDILSLGTQYLSDFVDTNDQKPEEYPLDLTLCQNCYLVQLKETTPSSSLYTDSYGYKSGINNTIRADLKEIVERVNSEIHLDDGDVVLDIGSNDGTLLSNYSKGLFRIGCDPLTKFAEECKQHADIVVNDYFSYDAINRVIPDKKPKVITAISCFYDLDKPNDFVADIAKLLDDDGIFIVQQNYLVGMMLQNAFDNICHEHVEYYSLLSLEKLLNRHGLEVFHIELNDINGGSFRTFIRKITDRTIGQTVFGLREAEAHFNLDKPEIYQEFAQRVKQLTSDLHDLIEKLVKEGKTVYTYGASTRGNGLLQAANLDKTLITAAVERNPEKWGKFIASSGIPIISEKQARKEKPDYMLVLPWYFASEFKVREKAYLNAGGHFIIPLPKVEVI